jgi:flagellar motor protein MotB
MATGTRINRLRKVAALLCCLSWLVASGCNQNPYANPYGAYGGAAAPNGAFQIPAAGGLPTAFNQPQLAELERRVQQLDVNNRQLTTQLAQSQQQMQVFRDRADLLQRQLQDTTAQLQTARLAQQQLEGQALGMQASMNQRGGAVLRPNVSQPPPGSLPGSTQTSQRPALGNQPLPGTQPLSGAQPLPGSQPGLGMTVAQGQGYAQPLQVPGAVVQQDGSVIRIRVPADQLFAPGTAQLHPSAAQLLDSVALAIVQSYPRQRVAVEGHTDTGNLYGGAFGTQYQLASAQGQAIMDQLVRRNGVPTQQLFVVAHGPNHPRGDNQSAAGRAENRRIEFVVYPDSF